MSVGVTSGDLQGFSASAEQVLNHVQQFVSFPGSSTNSAIKYQFFGELRVSVEASWAILPGFVLDSVSMLISLNTASDAQYQQVGLQVDASFTIQDVTFRVFGDLPDLLSGSAADFTLKLQLEDPQETLDARTFLTALDSALSFEAATVSVDSDLKSQLVDQSSQLLDATIVVQRTTAGSFFLKAVSLNLQAGFDWVLIENVTLRNLAVSVDMTRNDPNTAWQYGVGVSGSMLVQDVQVIAKAHFDVADTSSVQLGIEVSSLVGVGISDLLHIFAPDTATSAQTAIINQLPPSLTYTGIYMDMGDGSLQIVVVLRKPPSSTWSVSSAEVSMSLPGITWVSPAINNNIYQQVVLQDISLNAKVVRITTSSPTTEPGTLFTKSEDHPDNSVAKSLVATTTTDWDPSGQIRGVISLRDGQFILTVLVSYDSVRRVTILEASLPSGFYGSMTDLASDSAFSPPGMLSKDLGDLQNVGRLPNDSPIQLTSANELTGGTNRLLQLTFSDTELTRLLLRSQYSGTWQLTDRITLTDLGLWVDLQYPQSSDLTKSSVAGLVYGSFAMSGSINVFALIAGVKSTATTDIWASLSVDSIPGSTLGIAPNGVISDEKLFGKIAPVVGWGLPSSFPSASTALGEVFTSTQVYVDIKLSKISSNYNLSLLRVKASASSSWEIFPGLTLSSVQLTIFLQQPPGNVDLSGYVTISGTCEVGSASLYLINAQATFLRSPSSPSEFTSTLGFSKLNAPGKVLPSDITSLVAFGSQSIDTVTLVAQIPGKCATNVFFGCADWQDGFPIPASVFTTDSDFTFLCSATIITTAGSTPLKALSFQFSQNIPWIINSALPLTLRTSSIALMIQNPTLTGTARTSTLTMSGDLEIGSLHVSATLILVDSTTLVITVNADGQISASSILDALVTSNVATPVPLGSNLDIESTSSRFRVDITLEKISSRGWVMKRVYLKLSASLPWHLGTSRELIVSNLYLEIDFQNLDTEAQKTVSLVGNTSFGSSNAIINATLAQDSLTIAIGISDGADITTGAVISHYIDNWNSSARVPSLGAPDFTFDTGLQNYGSKVVASASILFVPDGTGYSPSSLTIAVGTDSGFRWTLIDTYLILTQLRLTLNMTNLANNPILDARLQGTLDYQNSSGSRNTLPLFMVATSRHLNCHMSLETCNFQQMVYVATAGKWNLSGSWMNMRSLDLDLNWFDKQGTFVATLQDWTFNGTLTGKTTILAMINPRLSLTVSKATVNLNATGLIAGEAVVFEKQIPISYQLPDGPLRIFGYDVKEIYKMCKRLKELYDDIQRIVDIMKDIVDAAEAIGEALVDLGYAAGLVWAIIKVAFPSSSGHSGSSGSNSSSNNNNNNNDDDDDNNNSGSGGSGSALGGVSIGPALPTDPWVIGGSGIGNGIGAERVTLLIYPKQSNGLPLIIDSSRLSVIIAVTSTITSFVAIDNGGYSASYVRPAVQGDYEVQIKYSTWYDRIRTCTVTTTASQISSSSRLDISPTALAGVDNYATIWPYDQDGKPVLGRGYSLHNVFTFEFTPALDFNFYYYNNCVQVKFRPAVAQYTVSAFVAPSDPSSAPPSQPLVNSPTSITCRIGLDISKCTVSGPGVCSGRAGVAVNFEVHVKDQFGNPFEPLRCDATCITAGSSLSQVSLLSQVAGTCTFSYIRPIASTYSINVTVNGIQLPQCPFSIQSIDGDVTFSTTKSYMTIPPPFISQKTSTGTITCLDSSSSLWRNDTVAVNFIATLINQTVRVPIVLQDQGEGIVGFNLSFPVAGAYQVEVKSATNDTQILNSPMTLNVVPAPTLSSFRLFGAGLNLTGSGSRVFNDLRYFDILPLDQYDNVLRNGAPSPTDISIQMRYALNLRVAQQSTGYRLSFNESNAITDDVCRLSLSPQSGSLSRRIELPGSPYLLRRVGVISDSVVSWRSHILNDISTVLVWTIDSNNFPLTIGGATVAVSSTGTDPAQWPFYLLSIEDLQNGCYKITYIPQALNMSISITVNDRPSRGSPFQLPTSALSTYSNDSAGSLTYSGPSTILTVTALSAGQPYDDSAVVKEAVLYSIDPGDTNLVPVSVTSVSGMVGKTAFAITSPPGSSSGDYRLRITANFVPIDGSPFAVIIPVPPPPPPPPVNLVPSVTGLNWFGICSEQLLNSFTVITSPPSMMSTADFQYTLIDQPVSRLRVRLEAQGTTLRVFFALGMAGTYQVTMKYKGIDIEPPVNIPSPAGSPNYWQITAIDQNRVLTEYVPGQPELGWYSAASPEVPIVTEASQSMVTVSKASPTSGSSSWAWFYWTMPVCNMSGGFILGYKMRWNTLSATNEAVIYCPAAVQAQFPAPTEDPTIRYDSTNSNQPVYWTSQVESSWVNQSPSAIRADGTWHYILYHQSNSTLTVYEDGLKVFQRANPGTRPIADEKFGCLVITAGIFDIDVMDPVTSPYQYRMDVPTTGPREIIFNIANEAINDTLLTSVMEGGIEMRYINPSLMIFTEEQSNTPCQATLSFAQPLGSVFAVQYMFQVLNAGSNSEIELANSVTWRLQGGQAQWAFKTATGWDVMSNSTSVNVGNQIVTVLIVASPSNISLYEDGVWKFDFAISAERQRSRAPCNAGIRVRNIGIPSILVEFACMRVIQGSSG